MAKKTDDFNSDPFEGFDTMDFPDLFNDRPKNTLDKIKDFAKGFREGTTNAVKQPNNIKEITNKVLPRGYGRAVSDALELGAGIKELYDEAGQEFAPVVNSLKQATGTVADALGNYLPKGVKEKAKRWADSARRGDKAKSDAELMSERIEAVLKETFGEQMKVQAQNEAREDARTALKVTSDNKHFIRNFNQLERLNVGVSRLNAYNDRIQINFQRKLLEINLKQYYIQAKTLETLQTSNKLHGQAFKLLIEESQKPDILKLRQHKNTRELYGTAQDADTFRSFFGSRGEEIQRIRENMVRNARQAIKDTAFNLSSLIGMADMGAGMAGTMGSFGPSKERMAGDMVGGFFPTIMANLFGGRVRKLLERNDRVRQRGNRLQYIAENFRPWINRQAGSSGVMGPLASILSGLMQDDRSRLDLKVDTISTINQPAVWKRQDSKSLTEIIPGLLAKIHQELRIIRTGDESIKPITYDYNKNTFSDRSSAAKGAIRSLMERDGAKYVKDDTYNLVDEIGQGKFDQETRQVLAKQLLSENYNRVLPERERLTNPETFSQLDSEKAKRVAKAFSEYFGEDKDKSKELEFSRRYNELGQTIGSNNAFLQNYVSSGQAGYFQDLGIIEDGRINPDKLIELYLSSDYSDFKDKEPEQKQDYLSNLLDLIDRLDEKTSASSKVGRAGKAGKSRFSKLKELFKRHASKTRSSVNEGFAAGASTVKSNTDKIKEYLKEEIDQTQEDSLESFKNKGRRARRRFTQFMGRATRAHSEAPDEENKEHSTSFRQADYRDSNVFPFTGPQEDSYFSQGQNKEEEDPVTDSVQEMNASVTQKLSDVVDTLKEMLGIDKERREEEKGPRVGSYEDIIKKRLEKDANKLKKEKEKLEEEGKKNTDFFKNLLGGIASLFGFEGNIGDAVHGGLDYILGGPDGSGRRRRRAPTRTPKPNSVPRTSTGGFVDSFKRGKGLIAGAGAAAAGLWRGAKNIAGKLNIGSGKGLRKLGSRIFSTGTLKGGYSLGKKAMTGVSRWISGSKVAGRLANSAAGKLLRIGGRVGIRTLGLGLGAAAAVVASPLVAGALATAAAAYTGYEIYKFFNRPKLGDLSSYRFAQYGFPVEDKGWFGNLFKDESIMNKIFRLEGYMTSHINIGTEGIARLKGTAKAEQILEILGFKGSDDEEQTQEQIERINEWLTLRFIPVFLIHVSVLGRLEKHTDLQKVDKLKIDQKLKYHEATRFAEGPYDVLSNPFGQEPLVMDKEKVALVWKGVEEQLKKKEPKEKLADYALDLSKGLRTDFSDIKEKTSPESKSTDKVIEGLDKDKDEQALKAQADAGSNINKVASASVLLAEEKLPYQLSAIDALRYKTYGLKEMDFHKVKALRKLEKYCTDHLQVENATTVNWSGDIEKTIIDNASVFGVGDVTGDDGRNFLTWFKDRFLKVFTRVASAVYQRRKSNLIQYQLDGMSPDERLEIANIIVSTMSFVNDRQVPVWHVLTSPWPGYELNSNAETTKSNIKALERELANKKIGQVAVGEELNKHAATSAGKSSTSATIPQKPRRNDSGPDHGAMYRARTNMPDSITIEGMAGSMSGPGIRRGTRYEMDAIKIGEGTGGLYDQITKPTGDGRYEYYKKTIEDVAKVSGVDATNLASYVGIESSFRSKAKAGTSSAGGLGQFIDSTWAEMLAKYGNKYGIPLSTPKTDPVANLLMTAEYMKQNYSYLQSQLGRPLDTADLYLAHFLGAGGATKFLTSDPNEIAAKILPQAASSNKPIFFDSSRGTGHPRTIDEIKQLIVSKIMKVQQEHMGLNEGLSTGLYPPKDSAGGIVTPETKTGTGVNGTLPMSPRDIGEAGRVLSREALFRSTNAPIGGSIYANNNQGSPSSSMSPNMSVKTAASIKDFLATIDPKLVEIGQQNITLKDKSIDLTGMNKDFMMLFYAMVGDFVSRGGGKIQINSAYRSAESQKQLYDAWIKSGKRGGMVARPGRSRHQSGVAIDIQSVQANALAQNGLLAKYNFIRPINGEPWHLENRYFSTEPLPEYRGFNPARVAQEQVYSASNTTQNVLQTPPFNPNASDSPNRPPQTANIPSHPTVQSASLPGGQGPLGNQTVTGGFTQQMYEQAASKQRADKDLYLEELKRTATVSEQQLEQLVKINEGIGKIAKVFEGDTLTGLFSSLAGKPSTNPNVPNSAGTSKSPSQAIPTKSPLPSPIVSTRRSI